MVQHIDDVVPPYEYSYIYALPMTMINIELGTEKKTIEKGPYAEYAEKYLDIQDAYSEDKEQWQLNTARITTYKEIDPLQYYLIQCENKCLINKQLSDYADKGLIFMEDNNSQAAPAKNNNHSTPNNDQRPAVPKYPVSGNLIEVTDTLYKTLFQDSAFVKVPVFRNRTIPKNQEQKAKETSELLIKLKQRELQLITGEDDHFPEEKTLKYSIREIRKIQKDMERLFTGMVHKNKYIKNYMFAPGNKSKDTTILCYFHKNHGFIAAEQGVGKPVFCIIERKNKTSTLEKLNGNTENNKKLNKIYYRIPDLANIKILFDGQVIAEQMVHIDQFGAIVNSELKE